MAKQTHAPNSLPFQQKKKEKVQLTAETGLRHWKNLKIIVIPILNRLSRDVVPAFVTQSNRIVNVGSFTSYRCRHCTDITPFLANIPQDWLAGVRWAQKMPEYSGFDTKHLPEGIWLVLHHCWILSCHVQKPAVKNICEVLLLEGSKWKLHLPFRWGILMTPEEIWGQQPPPEGCFLLPKTSVKGLEWRRQPGEKGYSLCTHWDLWKAFSPDMWKEKWSSHNLHLTRLVTENQLHMKHTHWPWRFQISWGQTNFPCILHEMS